MFCYLTYLTATVTDRSLKVSGLSCELLIRVPCNECVAFCRHLDVSSTGKLFLGAQGLKGEFWRALQFTAGHCKKLKNCEGWMFCGLSVRCLLLCRNTSGSKYIGSPLLAFFRCTMCLRTAMRHKTSTTEGAWPRKQWRMVSERIGVSELCVLGFLNLNTYL